MKLTSTFAKTSWTYPLNSVNCKIFLANSQSRLAVLTLSAVPLFKIRSVKEAWSFSSESVKLLKPLVPDTDEALDLRSWPGGEKRRDLAGMPVN